jgi:pimeloyl-ACP methyl ester carboxylesterase
LNLLSVPVLIAWRARDALLHWPRYSRQRRDFLPDAEFGELPGVGHLAQWDDPASLPPTIVLELMTQIEATPTTA